MLYSCLVIVNLDPSLTGFYISDSILLLNIPHKEDSFKAQYEGYGHEILYVSPILIKIANIENINQALA